MIREYSQGDLRKIAGVWLRSGQAEYHYLSAFQALDEMKAKEVFRHIIQDKCRIWVYESNEDILGFMAMNGDFVDRLYVDPGSQGKGIGSAFIEYAKSIYPSGLKLKTHQLNKRACAFYEERGFVVAGYGISAPPESMPDVEYHWEGAV